MNRECGGDLWRTEVFGYLTPRVLTRQSGCGSSGPPFRTEGSVCCRVFRHLAACARTLDNRLPSSRVPRSEEHTSELQSRPHLVCRLLLEKKNTRCPSARALSGSSHASNV